VVDEGKMSEKLVGGEKWREPVHALIASFLIEKVSLFVAHSSKDRKNIYM